MGQQNHEKKKKKKLGGGERMRTPTKLEEAEDEVPTKGVPRIHKRPAS